MFSYSLLIYPIGRDSGDDDVRLVDSSCRHRLHGRSGEHRHPWSGDGHADQYDIQRSDSSIHGEADLTGQLYERRDILCKCGAEPCIDRSVSEYQHMYDGTVHLFTYRHGGDTASGHDICMGCGNDYEYHGRGSSGSGPGEPDGDADQYKYDSGSGHGDLYRDTGDQYWRNQLYGHGIYGKRGGRPCIDDKLTE